MLFLLLSFLSCNAQKAESDYECKIDKTEKGDCADGKIRNQNTRFPASSPADDYEVKGCQAKIAFPVNKTEARIWVKGSEAYTAAKVTDFGGNPLAASVQLSAPFYTALISVPAEVKRAEVVFSGTDTPERRLEVFPKNREFLTREDKKFSLLYYGCFQPFRVNPDSGESEVLHQKDTLNYIIRKMFTRVAEEREFNFTSSETTSGKAKLLENPKAVIGGGDQVYTDAGYAEKEFENHPLSAWAHTCSDPYPLLDTVEFAQHLDRCYLHFNSFECFEKIEAALPCISTWDDHEIRDGWGSHGDEYDDDGTLAADLAPYYYLSRRAFIEHQYNLGPQIEPANAVYSNQSLEQKTVINGTDIFVFDLRSNRDNCAERVMKEGQMNNFKNWCKSLKDGKEAIIVSSIPFFYEAGDVVAALSANVYEGELRDDIIDSWASVPNKTQRDEIVAELIKLRLRDVKPIILSGDVHIGGLITAWFRNPKTNEFDKLCFEMISSGLSHEKMGEARSGIAATLQKRSSKVKKGDSVFKVNGIDVVPVFEFTRGRLNFGALEFTENKNTVASLFIIGDDEKSVDERELELKWEETFDSYWEKAYTPPHWYLMPWKWGAKKLPEVPKKTVSVAQLK